ncbi:MAG TPA: thiamine phosphate synthase [Bryobacteraceae bacterium]|nr:thiamine phosphate synthase [Bryobacteraceae bacterium]
MTAFPRFYPILDVVTLHRRGCTMPESAVAMIEGGSRVIQLRLKSNPTQRNLEDADKVAEQCRRHGVIWIVNDRADIALLTGAGLHLGQDDLPAATARGLMGEMAIIGLSTHNASQMRAATLEPVDYVAIGPVFATASKDQPDPEVGLEGITQVRMLTNLPMIAIGGITRDNVESVLDAGADSVAVIGDIYPDPCDPSTLRQRVRDWIRITG